MNSKEKNIIKGHIIFDHDGTLVNTDKAPYFLFVGMRELLVDLKSQGFSIYIWTARPRRSVIEIVKKLEIENFFEGIYCYDDGIPKPHPMGLESLTEGIPKNQIIHIGDSLSDIEGALHYGIEVVHACWNNPNQVEKYKNKATYSALSLDECRAIIKRKFYV